MSGKPSIPERLNLPIWSVTETTLRIKHVIEEQFPMVFVAGEISNLVRATSGHVYFTLKDETAQLKAVIWKSTAGRLKFDLHDGLEIIAGGAVELYPPRGQYQLIVQEVVPQGMGALELAFRQLQARLEAEGLFDAERKRPLPRYPRRIALVTSPTGAAVRDMLQVITRRWPACNVVIVPVAVQGGGAAQEIVQGLRDAAQIPLVDVIVAGRGGGSLEDLWSFNEEIVARAIIASPIPVVSAVGHEIDVTIADLVADRRALTPSEAGEIVVPDRQEVLQSLQHLMESLNSRMSAHLKRYRLLLDHLAERPVFRRPLDRLRWEASRLDDWSARLSRSVVQLLQHTRQNVTHAAGTLEALSPLRVLERGFSTTQNVASGKYLRRASESKVGDVISTRLHEGTIISRVEDVK
ncbi:MAG: exodeoxyribonuclease VII large subunit [Planctomycetota bacterium]|nr:exodeoxyribonuclease VII large subunit [Planctomycetota bacterium]MDA1211150.1 exodeoxyribonuclease VII large subunit [Planctomycetota bacterium]